MKTTVCGRARLIGLSLVTLFWGTTGSSQRTGVADWYGDDHKYKGGQPAGESPSSRQVELERAQAAQQAAQQQRLNDINRRYQQNSAAVGLAAQALSIFMGPKPSYSEPEPEIDYAAIERQREAEARAAREAERQRELQAQRQREIEARYRQEAFALRGALNRGYSPSAPGQHAPGDLLLGPEPKASLRSAADDLFASPSTRGARSAAGGGLLDFNPRTPVPSTKTDEDIRLELLVRDLNRSKAPLSREATEYLDNAEKLAAYQRESPLRSGADDFVEARPAPGLATLKKGATHVAKETAKVVAGDVKGMLDDPFSTPKGALGVVRDLFDEIKDEARQMIIKGADPETRVRSLEGRIPTAYVEGVITKDTDSWKDVMKDLAEEFKNVKP